MSIMSINSL